MLVIRVFFVPLEGVVADFGWCSQ